MLPSLTLTVEKPGSSLPICVASWTVIEFGDLIASYDRKEAMEFAVSLIDVSARANPAKRLYIPWNRLITNCRQHTAPLHLHMNL